MAAPPVRDSRSIRLRPTHARHWAEEQFNNILSTAAADRLATIGHQFAGFFDDAAALLDRPFDPGAPERP